MLGYPSCLLYCLNTRCTAPRSPSSRPHPPIVLPASPTVLPPLPALQPGPCPPAAPPIVLPVSLHCTAPTPQCTHTLAPPTPPHTHIVLPTPPHCTTPAVQQGPGLWILLPPPHCTAHPTPLYCPHCTTRVLASGGAPEGYSAASPSIVLPPHTHNVLPPLYNRVLASGGTPEGYSDYLTDKPPPLGLPTGIPSRDGSTSVYDYKFEVASRTWRLWTDTIEKLAIPNGAQFADIIIPTKDSAR